MRKVSTIIMALAVIMGMTQCTKPAMQLYDGSYTGVTKEITFSTGGSSKVEIENVLNELKFKWQTGDTLYVYGSANGLFTDGQYCGKLGIVRGMGTENGFFSGTLENVPETGKLRFYYCPKELFDKEHKTITVDLSSQDGSLEGVASHLVACADVTVKPDGGDYSATLAVPYSVVKLDLHEFGTTDITMTGTTKQCVTISGNGECTFTAATDPETTISGAGANTYISVIPESGSTTLSFEGDNGIVGSRDINLESNTFQTLNNGGDPVPVTGHEFVDLGLPSGTLWATCNLGATSPGEYGNYYAWGETAGYNEAMVGEGAGAGGSYNPSVVKTDYSWSWYKWGSEYNSLGKYVTKPGYGMADPDNLTTLQPADDAATANWGIGWRMPTAAEFYELKNNTTKIWKKANESITIGGVSVTMSVAGLYYVSTKTGYTDKYIFLPAAGSRFWTILSGEDTDAVYWSSSLYLSSPDNGCGWAFDENCIICMNVYDIFRYFGLSVRPVRASQK